MKPAHTGWTRIVAVTLANTVGLGPATFGAFLVGATMDGLGFTAIQAGALVSSEMLSVGCTAMLSSAFI